VSRALAKINVLTLARVGCYNWRFTFRLLWKP